MYMSRVRVAMIPISFELKDKAVVNELLIDYTEDLVYIKTDNGTVVYPSKEIINEYLLDELKRKNIYKDDMDLVLLLNESKEINDKVDSYMNTNGDNIGTDDIIINMKGIDTTDSLLDLIYYKVNKIENKILVSNNYSNFYKNKLATIETGADIYEHPESQVCSYEPPVSSVNELSGDIAIYKTHIEGLENVEKNANNYAHPSSKQCTTEFTIKTINNKDDREIEVTREDIGIDKVVNYPLLTSEEIHNNTKVGYVTPKAITDYIDILLLGGTNNG